MEPDFIKLDRYFSIDLQKSKQKQTMIKFLLKYSNVTNCKIILEGIENEEVLKKARKLGVSYAQGFHLGKPAALKHYLNKNIIKSKL